MKEENKPFFADPDSIEKEKYCVFTYYFETKADIEDAAAHLCREQSTALWKRVDVDEDFRPLHGAKVIELRQAEGFPQPEDKAFRQAIVRIAHPHINFGPKIPNLLTAACGEGAFFTPGIPIIKLLDIEFPQGYLGNFQGPRFGLEGIRSMLQVRDRPLITGVVKPNIGLKPRDFAELAYKAYLGGADITKDDEMLSDVAYSRTKERVTAVIDMMHKAQDRREKDLHSKHNRRDRPDDGAARRRGRSRRERGNAELYDDRACGNAYAVQEDKGADLLALRYDRAIHKDPKVRPYHAGDDKAAEAKRIRRYNNARARGQDEHHRSGGKGERGHMPWAMVWHQDMLAGARGKRLGRQHASNVQDIRHKRLLDGSRERHLWPSNGPGRRRKEHKTGMGSDREGCTYGRVCEDAC